jgi:hypothetical protein
MTGAGILRTKRAVARDLMRELKAAYADLDSQPYEDDPDRSAQALGRYDGLKRAYVLLTGRDAQDVAHEVVTWYIQTPEYQAAKARYGQEAAS